MEIYKTKIKKFKGHEYKIVHSQAMTLYKDLCSKTRRRPYLRSKYFSKSKIFLDLFWQHLHEKNPNDRQRRLKYYACAIDLIKNNTFEPIHANNPNKPKEKFYKFSGITESGDTFFVQIKETKKGQKHFMSVFPG